LQISRACSAALPVLLLFSLSCDTVNVSNGSGNENGLLVDGQDSAGVISDRGFVNTATAIAVGSLSAGAQNEVMAFHQYPPAQVGHHPLDLNQR